MPNVGLDKLLDFGVVTLGAAGTQYFPNVLNLKDTTVNRMEVEFRSAEPLAGGTGIQFIIQDSPDGSTFTTKVSGAVLDALDGVYRMAVEIADPFLRIGVTGTGTFTAGMINAQLNTYTGK
jgi:hypothetical protein